MCLDVCLHWVHSLSPFPCEGCMRRRDGAYLRDKGGQHELHICVCVCVLIVERQPYKHVGIGKGPGANSGNSPLVERASGLRFY